MLTDAQLERYSRHLILKEVGLAGQEKLLAARVLIVGAGGLGAPAALYLAAAGIGTIGVVDADAVDLTNLQRQVIHHTPDVGKEKVLSAAEKMRAINPDITVNTHPVFLRTDNIMPILADYDFVIDGTDNFAAKFLINDACHFAGKPYVHGGILRFEGQMITVLPGQTTCLRCVFGGPPPPDAVPSCSQAGVLGVLAGVLGTLQATEALKRALGLGTLLTDALLKYNALDLSFRRLTLRRNPRCPLCGDAPTITELRDEAPPACDLKSDCCC
ncbi:MAG TPA: molybdopterin-synthase adenylyltransferase MoeB [Candidatus Hydrogenedentes bacterium]|nr:molybdopterin-synthase adenylyltransferase MoeB [Candidatus Hydrogenedentota bacterium]